MAMFLGLYRPAGDCERCGRRLTGRPIVQCDRCGCRLCEASCAFLCHRAADGISGGNGLFRGCAARFCALCEPIHTCARVEPLKVLGWKSPPDPPLYPLSGFGFLRSAQPLGAAALHPEGDGSCPAQGLSTVRNSLCVLGVWLKQAPGFCSSRVTCDPRRHGLFRGLGFMGWPARFGGHARQPEHWQERLVRLEQPPVDGIWQRRRECCDEGLQRAPSVVASRS